MTDHGRNTTVDAPPATEDKDKTPPNKDKLPPKASTTSPTTTASEKRRGKTKKGGVGSGS